MGKFPQQTTSDSPIAGGCQVPAKHLVDVEPSDDEGEAPAGKKAKSALAPPACEPPSENRFRIKCATSWCESCFPRRMLACPRCGGTQHRCGTTSAAPSTKADDDTDDDAASVKSDIRNAVVKDLQSKCRAKNIWDELPRGRFRTPAAMIWKDLKRFNRKDKSLGCETYERIFQEDATFRAYMEQRG